jgi:hypothetical protein
MNSVFRSAFSATMSSSLSSDLAEAGFVVHQRDLLHGGVLDHL